MAIVIKKEYQPSEDMTELLKQHGIDIDPNAEKIIIEHHSRRDQLQVHQIVPQTLKAGTLAVSRNKEGDKLLEEFNFHRLPEYKKAVNQRVYRAKNRKRA